MNSASQRCERLRAALAEIAIDENGSETKLSASFGIACTASSGHEFRQLLAHADSALYRAKRAGRNRVMLYGDEAAAENSSAMDEKRLSA
jgi:diguanylate cyclase (GGDEF)-like protein